MPRRDSQGDKAQAKSKICLAAAMDFAAAIEGKPGRSQHDDSAEMLHCFAPRGRAAAPDNPPAPFDPPRPRSLSW